MNYALAFTRSPTHATRRRGNADPVETACAAGQGLSGTRRISDNWPSPLWDTSQSVVAVCCDVLLDVVSILGFWHIGACVVIHKGVLVQAL